jgi:hypothetical protein
MLTACGYHSDSVGLAVGTTASPDLLRMWLDLYDGGPASLSQVMKTLDRSIAVARILASEDLLSYLSELPYAISIVPSWLSWNDGCVLKIARFIDDQLQFSDLPILGDALEDAGCTNSDILMHCRSPFQHLCSDWVVDRSPERKSLRQRVPGEKVRSDWLVDLLLGRIRIVRHLLALVQREPGPLASIRDMLLSFDFSVGYRIMSQSPEVHSTLTALDELILQSRDRLQGMGDEVRLNIGQLPFYYHETLLGFDADGNKVDQLREQLQKMTTVLSVYEWKMGVWND